ncbi:MAG: bifunctional phosphoribosyl-AMP cyclohydrolase/phosphoribosyl-ATP pyrophosphatase [Bacillus thermozeamaize]|jgi:phosphoribosyl-ATP pyrophosphohydrolase/phosphoribosyl-AMP cyclohydrolase|uniref:Histidine biosynthesis bifunctional protein HisIE n=1 Tax=Bacillus thermozeamaize TaxID=230954 RepID=A0A1Y3PL51_9BACI|nr:MAG: bifunctional phosphoribosyl-AMP cyclohydrolase/phosphoribosyl-ATP pyrophosphatase [Bacillus thermozeamaize]
MSAVVQPNELDNLRWNEQGLIPVIVQDVQSKAVLMLAYMNRESLKKTIETGNTWFWSRSRQRLWQKGETSGHVQRVREIRVDCDRDTLLVLVEQSGPACHEGTYSCFSRPLAETFSSLSKESEPERFAILNHLEAVIAARDAERPEGAYTTYLFEKGLDKILKKVGEEAAEVIIAAKNRDAKELRWEISDLIYHLLVLMREQRLPLDDVLQELAERHQGGKAQDKT